MIIVAFCTKTSKLLPRIVCRHFKHCAPIVPAGNANTQMIMYQFVRQNKIIPIPITARGLRALRAHGWAVVCVAGATPPPDLLYAGDPTCVAFTKRACGLRRARIQTPDALYKYLVRLNTV